MAAYSSSPRSMKTGGTHSQGQQGLRGGPAVGVVIGGGDGGGTGVGGGDDEPRVGVSYVVPSLP
jgi:hypothetical protein